MEIFRTSVVSHAARFNPMWPTDDPAGKRAEFLTRLNQAVDEHFPLWRRRVSVRGLPWLTREVIRALKQRDEAHLVMVKNRGKLAYEAAQRRFRFLK